MCEVQLMRISQNSLHVISTFRIPMMAIRMAQIKAFRRNNGVRCVIVGVASFTYVKEANDTKKSVHSPTPAPLRLALAEQRICNVCVAVAYLSHNFRHSQLHYSQYWSRFDRSGLQPQNFPPTRHKVSILPILSRLTHVQRITVRYKSHHGVSQCRHRDLRR